MTKFLAHFRALALNEKVCFVAFWCCLAFTTVGVFALFCFGWRPSL